MNALAQLVDDLRLLEPPVPFRLQAWQVAAALALIGAIWWVVRWRRATQGARLQAHAERQAHEDALAELQKLFALIDREESRPYALESSAIIRRYIEARFGFRAPRQATEEFLSEVRQSPRLEAPYRGLLGEFLGVCDLLKFAKTMATRDELKELHSAAVRFVTETRHVPKEAQS